MKEQYVNDFVSIVYQKDKASLLIEGEPVLEIPKKKGFYIAPLKKNKKEEMGIAIAFESAYSDERQALPCIFAYYIDLGHKDYRILPLISTKHIGLTSSYFYLLKKLKQNKRFTLDALSIASIVYSSYENKPDVDLESLKTVLETYLLDNYGREGAVIIANRRIKEQRNKHIGIIEKLRKIFLRVLVDDILNELPKPDSHTINKLHQIVENMESSGIGIFDDGVIPFYHLGEGVKIDETPIIINTSVYWAKAKNRAKLHILYLLPFSTLPTYDEIVKRITTPTDEDIVVEYNNAEGKFERMEIPSPYVEAGYQVLTDITYRIYSMPEILEIKENQ